MYSVILAAALTAGGQTADWHGRACAGQCYGSCYGNYGIDGTNCCGGCYGYNGDWGGCHGCWGSYGNCYGGCYGSHYPWDWSSYGCNGCWGTYGGISPYFPQTPVVAPVPATPPAEPLPAPKKPGESAAPTKARLLVDVPADARLYIDDRAMKTSSEHRTYQTPDLEPGQTYFYEVRVEVERDGKVLSETKRVLLKAGDEARADFTGMAATATAAAK